MLEQVLVGVIGMVALLMAVRALAPSAWLARHAGSLAQRLDGGATRPLARLLRAWAPSPDAGCGGCGGGCSPATGETSKGASAVDAGAAGSAPHPGGTDEPRTQRIRVLRRSAGQTLREVPLEAPRRRRDPSRV